MNSNQLNAIQISLMVGSTFSFLGSLAMMIHILKRHPYLKKANTSYQLLCLLSLVSVLGAPAMFLNRLLVNNSGLCQAQAYSVQFTVLSLPILCFCISLNFYLMMTNQGVSLRDGRKFLYLSIALGLGVPFVLATITLANNAYGNALIWCWITKERNDLRMSMFYAPLWIIIIMGIVLNLLAIWHVYGVEKEIQRNDYKFTRTVSKVLLYGLVFVVCWIPGTTNRLNETVQGSSPLSMIIAHCIGTTSLGFWTSVVYFTLAFLKHKKAKQAGIESAKLTESVGGSVTRVVVE